MRSGMAKGEREGSSLLLWPTLLGLELCPIQDRLCSRRPSRRCQNRDCWGRERRSVLRLGERSESSPDSMITSPVTTTEVPSSTGSGICPCSRRFGQVPEFDAIQGPKPYRKAYPENVKKFLE